MVGGAAGVGGRGGARQGWVVWARGRARGGVGGRAGHWLGAVVGGRTVVQWLSLQRFTLTGVHRPTSGHGAGRRLR